MSMERRDQRPYPLRIPERHAEKIMEGFSVLRQFAKRRLSDVVEPVRHLHTATPYILSHVPDEMYQLAFLGPRTRSGYPCAHLIYQPEGRVVYTIPSMGYLPNLRLGVHIPHYAKPSTGTYLRPGRLLNWEYPPETSGPRPRRRLTL